MYLTTLPHQPLQPIQEMQREVNTLLQSAGYRVDWRQKGESSQSVEGASVAVLQLRGVCQVPENPGAVEPLTKNVSLASSAVVDGEVLPFSWLECETLTKMLSPFLALEPGAKRDFLYGRAMGRLVAHEFLHVLANSREHDHAGVGKPSFSARDVLSERFQFESASLLRTAADGSLDPDLDTEDAARR
ncbi:MAG TPA: hypothetical protein VGN17_09640 [Bryobacteraceae bacterium]